METDKQCLNKHVINLIGKTERVGRESIKIPCRNNLEEVKKGGNVVPLPQKSMDSNLRLFDYNFYNDYKNRFDLYLEYGKR